MEETKKFEAEVQQLLHLVIHSLYSNKDIFLRELIANSADAIDKARFEAVTKPEMALDWEITIEADKKRKILRINDNGIGMTRDEIIRDIGTIARSGTKAFVESLQVQKNTNIPELVGQFGVGFYSAFMVADKIEVISKKAGCDAKAVRWESKGEKEYIVDDANRTEPGTEVILHLKPDCIEYLEDWKIREIVKKYSDFIEFPIRLLNKEKKSNGSGELDIEVLNSGKALWLKPSSSISEEEYQKFYSHLSHTEEEPILRIHYSGEGAVEFRALLFIPAKAPFDLFIPEESRKGVQLYIRRVFITDEAKVLLPDYLRFVKGVVESNDLPLNVSREMLQDSPQIAKIQKSLVKKILSELKKLSENNPEKYLQFYAEFKNTLKEGLHTDYSNKDTIIELLRFDSLKSEPNKPIGFKEYCNSMSSQQNEIYCFLAENKKTAESSPLLEFFKSNNIDVLLMTDPIDEWIIPDIGEYSGKKLKIVGKSNINYESLCSDSAKKIAEEANKKQAKFLEAVSKILENEVKEVRFSPSLASSPACIKSNEFSPGIHFEKIMKAMKQEIPAAKKIFELNPQNEIVKSLCSIFDSNPDDPRISDYIQLLYDQALIADGKPARDMALFSKRLCAAIAEATRQKSSQ